MITGMPRIAIATTEFEGIVQACREGLGMPIVDISDATIGTLGAKLAMCVPAGGSNIELMSPAVPEAPLSVSLQKFLGRRGQGLFALMLEAPDPNAEAERLQDNGLPVLPLMAGAGGRDLHPRGTCGVLIRIYPNGSFQASEDQISTEPTQALGLSGIARVIIAVAHLDAAAEIYGKKLGLVVEAPVVDEDRGVETRICRPPSGGTIELVAPVRLDRPFAASIRDQLQSRGEGMYALVLEAADPETVLGAAQTRGISARASDTLPGAAELDLFGARVLIVPASAAVDPPG